MRDLELRGLPVFRPTDPQHPFDLLVFEHGRARHVEVKSACYSGHGTVSLSRLRIDPAKFEVLAAVTRDSCVHYFTADLRPFTWSVERSERVAA